MSSGVHHWRVSVIEMPGGDELRAVQSLLAAMLATALGGELLRAQLINAGLTHGVKFIVNRERPDGGSYSFPSGHTGVAF